MRKLFLCLALALSAFAARSQYYTYYYVTDGGGNPLVNYPVKFIYTAGPEAGQYDLRSTGGDPVYPNEVTFFGSSTGSCGKVVSVNPHATITGDISSCMSSSPTNNHYITATNVNATDFKINGIVVSTNSATPTTIWYCNSVYTLNMDNTSWYPAKISGSTLNLYTIGSGTPFKTIPFGAGGAPTAINLASATYLGNTPGNYRISLTNTFNDGTPTQEYSGYITVQNATALVDFLMISPVDVSATGSGNAVCGTGPTYGTQPKHKIIAPATNPSFTPVAAFDASTVPPPCVEGWLGATTVGITNNSATVVNSGGSTSFNVLVQEYSQDPGTGNLTFIKNVVNKTSATQINNIGYGFNSRSTPLNYFSSNYNTIKNNLVYKVTYSVTTAACGVNSQYSFFKILDGNVDGQFINGGVNGFNIEDMNKEHLTVFPNPATDKVHVSWYGTDEKAPASINIVDVMGHVVLKKNINQIHGSNDVTLDISSLAPGIYHYTLTTGNAPLKGSLVKQ